MKGSTPKFDFPPVVETVIGVQYAQMPETSLVDLADLQSAWSDKFPTHSHHLGDPGLQQVPPPGGIFPISVAPPVRFWSVSADQQGLVQSQLDRLILNWRQIVGSSTYPGFDSQFQLFKSLWSKQSAWAQAHSKPVPSPFEVEVTYVNNLGEIEEPAPYSALSILGNAWESFPGRPAQSGFAFQHVLDVTDGHPFNGRINVNADFGSNPAKPNDLIMTCSAVLVVDAGADFLEAIETAHALATNAFAASITPRYSEKFGRR